jgi:2-polyprenyl-3-methyl-5-hydroxy-6-metoxy-1,4-benzoquinol methylase
MSRALYEAHVARLVLDLREALVRHDDNAAALALMENAVPWFLLDHPEISRQREQQRQMCMHLIDPEAYREYYRTNAHERPFEEQTGLDVATAHEHIHRLAFLRRVLDEQLSRTDDATSTNHLSVLDVSCNDGAFAANLAMAGYTCDGMDLNPDCIARAQVRKQAFPLMGRFDVGDFIDYWLAGDRDVIACLETIEHVANPDEAMRRLTYLCKPTGRIVISTPNGVDHGGDLPNWDHVEPKGHVRVYTPKTFHELLSRHGTVERMEQGPDGVMVAEVSL